MRRGKREGEEEDERGGGGGGGGGRGIALIGTLLAKKTAKSKVCRAIRLQRPAACYFSSSFFSLFCIQFFWMGEKYERKKEQKPKKLMGNGVNKGRGLEKKEEG